MGQSYPSLPPKAKNPKGGPDGTCQSGDEIERDKETESEHLKSSEWGQELRVTGLQEVPL